VPRLKRDEGFCGCLDVPDRDGVPVEPQAVKDGQLAEVGLIGCRETIARVRLGYDLCGEP
jgi:hypothetical protein